MKLQLCGAFLVLLLPISVAAANADQNGVIVIKSSKARLPSAFLSVLNELEKSAADAAVGAARDDSSEAEDDTTTTTLSTTTPTAACMISSRTLTRKERHSVRQVLLGLSNTEALSVSSSNKGDKEEEGLVLSVADSVKAAGCYFNANQQSNVVCLAMPESLAEVTACTVATGGNIVYIPSAMDLARGEGLLEQLGPAMQQILMNKAMAASAKLTVVILLPSSLSEDEDEDDSQAAVSAAKQKLIQAVEPLLQHLVSDKPVATLTDVFQRGVEFTTLQGVADQVWDSSSGITSAIVKDAAVLARASVGVPGSGSSVSAADEIASRVLAPQAQRIVRQSIETVKQAIREEAADGSEIENDGGRLKLIPWFGEMCSAEINSAMAQFQQVCRKYSKAVTSCRTAREIKDQMLDSLTTELQGGSLAWKQMELLFGMAFREFRVNVAKVERILGPKLDQEMIQVAQTSLREFTARAQKLTKDTTVTGPAISEFRRTCHEMVTDRLLELRASNKFKPLPRKGVTIGMHWLLPKPFGNDYRQEPWDLHATDNLVYVPSSKLADVNPKTISSGDWRNQIVPSPVGNDFIYTQN